MSVVRCDKCDRLIDSDYDCDCFVNNGDYIACESCRSDMEEAGELDVESNTLTKTPNPNKTINGETFAQFVARMEAQPGEEP